MVDKRHVRRDHADVFCTLSEGIRGKRALQWKLVDEVVPRSKLADRVAARAREFAEKSDRPDHAKGLELTPLNRTITDDSVKYDHVSVQIDHSARTVRIHITAPEKTCTSDINDIIQAGVDFWPLALARELDDAILHLRANETEPGIWIFTTSGNPKNVVACDTALTANGDNWLVREITLYLKRVFKRIDITSRSIITLIEPGSCFAGTLLELVLCADRSYMLDGTFEDDDRPQPTLCPRRP